METAPIDAGSKFVTDWLAAMEALPHGPTMFARIAMM